MNEHWQQNWLLARLRPGPRPGDVIVSRRTASADIYEIGVAGGPIEIVIARYPKTIEQACGLAARLCVDAWYTDDHTHFMRLAEHRTDDVA